MAYGGYFPQSYQQAYPQAYYGMPQNPPTITQNAQQQQNNPLTWVQGEAAAKAYPVASGQSVLLMDSEDSTFYIKSTDPNGMPQPLRIFDYTERTASKSEPAIAKSASADYVSRSEFEQFREDVKRSIKRIREEDEADG